MAGILGFDEGGEGIDFEGRGSEWFETDACFFKEVCILTNPVGVLGAELESDWEEQALGGNTALKHAVVHLLEENSFVGCVLVYQN